VFLRIWCLVVLIIFPEIHQPLLCTDYDGPSTGSDYSRRIRCYIIQKIFKDEESSCGNAKRLDNKTKNDCAILKEAYRWYFMLVFITDIVLVLCLIVVLLLFADWILFLAPVRNMFSFIDVHILLP
jgi:hypothetical protein